jgi:hypothetical protein
MRIFADKHATKKSKNKDKERAISYPRPAAINQDIVTALFSKAPKSRFPSPTPSSLSTPSSSCRSLSAVHLLLRAHACVSGGGNEDIPLLNFLPDDMKSEVKILRLGKNLAFDGTTPAGREIKEEEYDQEPECNPQPLPPINSRSTLEDENKLPTLNFDLELDL